LCKCYRMHVFEFYASHILEKLFKDSLLFLRWSAVVSKHCPARPASSTPPPLDIIRMGVPRWTFLPICVWLGHSPTPKKFARATCIFPRVPEAPEAPFHRNPSSCVPRHLPPRRRRMPPLHRGFSHRRMPPLHRGFSHRRIAWLRLLEAMTRGILCRSCHPTPRVGRRRIAWLRLPEVMTRGILRRPCHPTPRVGRRRIAVRRCT
jgi:hypothetical protein